VKYDGRRQISPVDDTEHRLYPRRVFFPREHDLARRGFQAVQHRHHERQRGRLPAERFAEMTDGLPGQCIPLRPIDHPGEAGEIHRGERIARRLRPVVLLLQPHNDRAVLARSIEEPMSDRVPEASDKRLGQRDRIFEPAGFSGGLVQIDQARNQKCIVVKMRVVAGFAVAVSPEQYTRAVVAEA